MDKLADANWWMIVRQIIKNHAITAPTTIWHKKMQ